MLKYLSIFFCIMLLLYPLTALSLPGDVNEDGSVDLIDTLITLKIQANIPTTETITSSADVNQDGHLDNVEAIFSLMAATGLAPGLTDEDLQEIKDLANITAGTLSDLQSQARELASLATTLEQILNFGQLVEIDSITELITFLNGIYSGSACVSNIDSHLTPPAYISLTFSGDPACEGLGGIITIAPEKTDGTLYLNITFDNLYLGDGGCLINGDMSLSTTKETENIVVAMTLNNLFVCSDLYNGTVAVRFTHTGQLVSVEVSNLTSDYTLEDGTEVTVVATIVYTPANGLSGTATITENSTITHTLVFNNVTFDSTCGLPNSGNVVIDEEITLDFSTTTCTNQEVEVTYKGMTFTASVSEAGQFIVENDPEPVAIGATLFSITCGVCHTGNGIGIDLYGDRTGRSATQIKSAIDSVQLMAPLKGVYSDEEIDYISTFLNSDIQIP